VGHKIDFARLHSLSDDGEEKRLNLVSFTWVETPILFLHDLISCCLYSKVVALVGVRKLFDFGLFTQQELKWLDDIMPESTKKKKEDAKKKKEEEANLNCEVS